MKMIIITLFAVIFLSMFDKSYSSITFQLSVPAYNDCVNISNEFVPDATTIALWHLDGDWADGSGNSHHLTISGSPEFVPGSPQISGSTHAVHPKQAFMSSNPDLIYTNDIKYSGSGGLTIELWAKFDTLPSARAWMIQQYTPGVACHEPFVLGIENGNFYFHVEGSGGCSSIASVTADASLYAGQWFHIAGVFDPGYVRLFINNSLVAEQSTNIIPESRTAPLYICSQWDFSHGHSWNFYVDEIRISNIARYGVNFTPVANAGTDITIECTSCCSTSVQLDGSASYDPNEDPLTFKWYIGENLVAEGQIPTIILPLGTTTIKLIVNDGKVDSEPDFVDITIEDTTPPEISVSVNPNMLWPPNHQMELVNATVTVNDACDPNPTVVLTSITSNEPDDAKGGGDGNTTNDIQGAEVGTNDTEFYLRAERDGSGSGRIYMITYTATDASGNSAQASATVIVPHDEGQNSQQFANQKVQLKPTQFELLPNYPNPFNASTTIHFALPEDANVELEIFNSVGQRTSSLLHQQLASGVYSIKWDAADIPSGIYFCKIKAGHFEAIRKLILMK